jgi:hypothetical protein
MSAISTCGKALVGDDDIYPVLDRLREICIRCFCDEICDFQPRHVNVIMAGRLMKSRGNPRCVKDKTPEKVNKKFRWDFL